jgi:hypothetical protein
VALPGGKRIMQQILGVFGYLEMDAGQGGDFGFYILLAQQVQASTLIVTEIWLRKNQALCFSIRCQLFDVHEQRR